MKLNRYIILAILPAILSSCNDWLTEDAPMTNRPADYLTSAGAALQVVNAAYSPLMWEYNNTYYSEFFIGDIASDDALKGGQNVSDMADAYDIENFKTISNNGLLLDYYRANFQGVARANLAMAEVAVMALDETFDAELRDRIVAEAHFLRGFYYFRLVRMFGGVPKIEKPIYSSADWVQSRASVDDIFALIVSDFEAAEAKLPKKSGYSSDDLGRATSGAAQAMLMKTHMFWAGFKDLGLASSSVDCWAEAKEWGDRFMLEQTAEYSLCPSYADNFTLEGENGQESVFEIQYMVEATSDYGVGNGSTRGTFSTMLMRSRSAKSANAGWGFNKPTDNLVAEFEAGDPRLDASVRTPKDSDMSTPSEEIYLGCRHVAVKRTLPDSGIEYITLAHASRSPINNVVIRLADVYLMYAEICLENNDAPAARTYLEKVRSRARGSEDILPAFPAYQVPDYRNAYAMHQLTDTAEDLEMAIRHERRVELAMEGHRWFDLVRWGIVKEVMDAYKAQESEEARQHMGEFIEGKHELFPIPYEETVLSGLGQNNGY
ncbi:MAG: RagB/SusD family nutrient uptake outer membrane protein [Bacteroidales bacterium]|nr:RagB/SusD family nutrient uptake outer membrane protein [Bacteroidales bacterium]